MNRKLRIRVLLFIGLAAIACCLIWVWAPPRGSPMLKENESPAKREESLRKEGIEAQTEQIKKQDPKLWQRVERFLQSEANIPIHFYGKVVDETGVPVESARIYFGWIDLSPAGGSHRETQSDRRGLFLLEGVRGNNVSVRVEKEGYITSQRNPQCFEYADPGPEFYVPDPANPVVFHLRRKGTGEKLIPHHVQYGLPYDHVRYFYSLQSGIITREATADVGESLTVSVTRTISGRYQQYDWTFTVEAANGGLQETADEFPYLAPADGYVQSWKTSHSAGDLRFIGNVEVSLYVRTSSGRYARVHLELTNPSTRESGADLIVDSHFNPSGSRILEPTK